MKRHAFFGKGLKGLVAGISLAVGFFAGQPLGHAASDKVVTVGLLSCLTGAQAVIGNTCKYGWEQAIEYINKEKLLGDIELKHMVLDDQLNATVGVSVYQGAKDKVLGFVGYDTSGISAIKPFAIQDKKPFIAVTTNWNFINPPSEYVFSTVPPYEEIVYGMMQTIKANWKEARTPRLGLISFETPSGRVAVSAAKKYSGTLGWEVDPVTIVPPTAVDFSEAIAQIKAKKPDWVLMSLSGGQMKNVLSQAKVAGVKDKTNWLLPYWGAFTDSAVDVVGRENLEGVYGTCQVSHPEAHEGAKKWAEWTKANGGKACDESGNTCAAGAFVLAEAIKKALEKVSLKELDGPNLSKHGIQRIQNFTIFGDFMPPVNFGPGQSQGSSRITVLRMINGKVTTAIPWSDVPRLSSEQK